MGTKKHIDRLFREQFKNLEAVPPSVVWDNIASALKKDKKNKRALPLWYKLAGVAAALLLLFSISGIFFINTDKPQQITTEETKLLKNKETIPAPERQNEIVFQQDQLYKPLIQDENKTNFGNPRDNETNQKLKNETAPTKITSSVASNGSQKISQNENPVVATSKEKSPDLKDIPFEIKTPNSKITETTDIAASKTEKKGTPTVSENAEEEVAQTETNPTTEKKKSLLEHIAEKEEVVVSMDNSPKNRWEVSPNFAPVYYSSFGKGSSISPEFSDNSKSGDVNFSYGLQVSYAINDKLSIRTGINKVDLSYVTNDIEYTATDPSNGLQSIDYKNNGFVVAVGNIGTLSGPPSNLPAPPTDDEFVIILRSNIIPGTMTQQLDYYEIPLELKYSLLESKFGVNIIGGMSTLLLNNNSVSVTSNGFDYTIGSANNLNSLSFSTNLGLGLDYKLTNRFIFNLEPMFKYQVNPYSDNSIDFKPYYLGVYSGFSYKF